MRKTDTTGTGKTKEETKTFRVAAFAHNEETSLRYRAIPSLQMLLKEITHIVEDTQADYVSLRIIRKHD